MDIIGSRSGGGCPMIAVSFRVDTVDKILGSGLYVGQTDLTSTFAHESAVC
jgi:hypothetical protein